MPRSVPFDDESLARPPKIDPEAAHEHVDLWRRQSRSQHEQQPFVLELAVRVREAGMVQGQRPIQRSPTVVPGSAANGGIEGGEVEQAVELSVRERLADPLGVRVGEVEQRAGRGRDPHALVSLHVEIVQSRTMEAHAGQIATVAGD